jgi:hypothetical protein
MDMIEELSRVALTESLPEHQLEAGDIGTVVLVHQGGEGYEVAFASLNGETLVVTSVHARQVRPARPERLHMLARLADANLCCFLGCIMSGR